MNSTAETLPAEPVPVVVGERVCGVVSSCVECSKSCIVWSLYDRPDGSRLEVCVCEGCLLDGSPTLEMLRTAGPSRRRGLYAARADAGGGDEATGRGVVIVPAPAGRGHRQAGAMLSWSVWAQTTAGILMAPSGSERASAERTWAVWTREGGHEQSPGDLVVGVSMVDPAGLIVEQWGEHPPEPGGPSVWVRLRRLNENAGYCTDCGDPLWAGRWVSLETLSRCVRCVRVTDDPVRPAYPVDGPRYAAVQPVPKPSKKKAPAARKPAVRRLPRPRR